MVPCALSLCSLSSYYLEVALIDTRERSVLLSPLEDDAKRGSRVHDACSSSSIQGGVGEEVMEGGEVLRACTSRRGVEEVRRDHRLDRVDLLVLTDDSVRAAA